MRGGSRERQQLLYGRLVRGRRSFWEWPVPVVFAILWFVGSCVYAVVFAALAVTLTL
jgi:hypothetical protein